MAAWYINARERLLPNGRGTGTWTLFAGKPTGVEAPHPGCDHPHPNEKEAKECLPARVEISNYTGIPLEKVGR